MAYILIVDDDELISALARDALQTSGHVCGWVENGKRALDVLSRKRPDMLLLDQDMPGMSGNEVLRHLRQNPHTYDLPVIMFTALNGKQDEDQALYAGAQDYVRKPFAPDFLLWRVERLLQQRANQPRHQDLKTVLEKSAGIWRDPDEGRLRAL